MINDIQYFFICLLAICMSSLEKYLFRFFARFLIWLFVFWWTAHSLFVPPRIITVNWGTKDTEWSGPSEPCTLLTSDEMHPVCLPWSSRPFWPRTSTSVKRALQWMVCASSYRGQWLSGMWLWTSPRRSGSSWSLRRRTCTETWWWRSAGTWSRWVRGQLCLIFYHLPVTSGWHRNKKDGQILHVGCSNCSKLKMNLIGDEVGKSIYLMYNRGL